MKTIAAIAVLLALAAVASAGVPRRGRFQGALNRGRECTVVAEREECARRKLRMGADVAAQEEAAAAAAEDEIPELWYHEQRLDHFNGGDRRVWSQRFFMNSTFLREGGPVFLLLGGEGPIHNTDVTTHFALSSQAAEFNALTISLEHRFYGKSQPLPDTSTDNLRYLSSQQALADAAAFIEWLPTQYPAVNGSKWIVFGGSYSGSLSAWFREKYPHLANGAIASSAPVHAQLDFPEYLETVSNSLGSSCSAIFAKATASIEDYLQQGSSGRATLEGIFNTCDPMNTEKDVATFLSFITDEVAGIVQYNNDNNNYEPMNIDGLCDLMKTSNPDPVHAWANFINESLSGGCTPVSYTKQVEEMRITSRVDTAARAWYWQTCTEFGYYQTGSSSAQPFSPRITLGYFVELCEDVYHVPMKPDTAWTNGYYGSTNLQSSRIVLPNGSVDPWHNLGVLSPPNLQEQVSFMNGTAHVADLYPPSPNDLPALTETREVEMAAITRWLQLPITRQ
eukprot:TRINITY_DN2117_c1_g1_i2.p1 TRINITY_DN2117_c1_g1~~TRINITY_DN2117_c1_g1_i2.p1  ORF type:complete len:508 (-),score=178.90 TRINITY_DN2117_c1_g1_i2:62-1585(-)